MKHPFVLALLLFVLLSGIGYAQTTGDKQEQADVPFNVIDKVPAYPGCLSEDNEVLKKCVSTKIQDFFAANFNIALTKSLNLTPGRKRIAVQFKIDKEGKVTDIKSKAPHPKLEEEAIRVASSLPQMKAGVQRGKKVNVLYALPILFEITPPKRARKKQNKNS